jgi:DNA-binding LacI/PurR family transcriptional regulator
MRMLLYAARSPQEEIVRLGDLLDGGEVDAVVVTGTFQGDPRTGWLSQRGLPFVSFGRPWGVDDLDAPEHLWVDVDGAAGTAAATRHALQAAGAHVAFLGWPGGSGTGDDRERGWREALAHAGAQGPRWIAEEDVARARAVVTRALRSGEAVDAVVCASDSLAIGAQLGAADAGHPEMLVIGFDNTPAAEALGLSSVEQLPERVAAGALELLMGETGSVVAPRPAASGSAHVLVEPRLVVR